LFAGTLLVLSGSAISACFTQANLPERVTVENIRRVELGMTRQEVESILGPPTRIEGF
jgi:outer membrane protein assembly factor BamE (lipoprotein component of BamABCDE complex)